MDEINTALGAFQGTLLSLDHQYKITSIASKGGNEDKVKAIIKSMKNFLKSQGYIDDNGLIEAKESMTRKFAMFIVLNSDLPVLTKLLEIDDLENWIWSIPSMCTYLMCEMIWQLHFEKFIYEMIPASWPQLGIEVAKSFISNFKYLDPVDCLNTLYKLSAACYALLCRLAYFKYEDDDTLSTTATDAFVNFEKCLKYYTEPPNKYRLDTLVNVNLYKYKGNRLKTLLKLVYDCFDMFDQNINTNNDDTLYKLTYDANYLHDINCKVHESPNTTVVECLNNSNTILLDIFQNIVMDVSVNIFCAWSEYEEDGKSFQQIIGELCHKVQEKLENTSSVAEHPVVSMIRLMARKPTAIRDTINSTDVAVILEKINNNDEHSSSWIHALVYYENLYQEFELLRIVDAKLNIYDAKECYKLHKILKKPRIENSDDQQFLFNLRLRLLSRCDLTDKHKILKAKFKNQIFCDNMRHDDDFDTKLNEMFNKFIADTNVDLTDVLTVFYQNPRKVYTKIFNLASRNTELIETMLRLMIILKDYTKYYYGSETEPCMVHVMKLTLASSSDDVDCGNNTIQFICKLKENEIIESTHLLLLIIMPSIHAALLAPDIKRLHNQVQLLLDAYTMDELSSYRAPMLVVVAQIMDTVRLRNLNRFRLDAIQTLEMAIRFQKSVMSTYRDVIPDTDGSWLREKVRNLDLTPLNLYYFKSLWNVNHRSFLETITGNSLRRDIPISELAMQIARLLPLSTVDEWCMIWDDMIAVGIAESMALRCVHSTVAALSEAVRNYRTDKTRAGIIYCYTNLVHLMRFRYLKEPLTNSHVKDCAAYTAKNLNTTHPDDAPELETVIMPFLAYLSSKKYQFTVDITKYFRNTRFLDVVTRFFPAENADELRMQV